MLVLGIESSCDETAIAVVRDGTEVLSNCIASQTDLLTLYGGVYPEQASRRHLEVCEPLLNTALAEAGVSLEQIDVIAVTQGPGLIGSLLVGLNFAKGLAYQTAKPLVGINHLEAHLYAACMGTSPLLPALGLVISGGHTSLLFVEEIGSYRLLGQTQDDAIGEAFDKVARLLNLPYPGGPEIERMALQGDSRRFAFKPGQVKGHPLDFSFSGLKTAVRYAVQKIEGELPLADLAASFQRAAFETVAEKLVFASQKMAVRSILLGGGVSHSQSLRRYLSERVLLPLYWPAPGLSLDNGAMIAGLGAHVYRMQGAHGLDIQVMTRIPFHA